MNIGNKIYEIIRKQTLEQYENNVELYTKISLTKISIYYILAKNNIQPSTFFNGDLRDILLQIIHMR